MASYCPEHRALQQQSRLSWLFPYYFSGSLSQTNLKIVFSCYTTCYLYSPTLSYLLPHCLLYLEYISCHSIAFLSFFFFFWLPRGIWNSWARDQLWATVVTYYSCGNIGSFNPLPWARDWTCVLPLHRHHWSSCTTPQ